jgi:hypothetical protein
MVNRSRVFEGILQTFQNASIRGTDPDSLEDTVVIHKKTPRRPVLPRCASERRPRKKGSAAPRNPPRASWPAPPRATRRKQSQPSEEEFARACLSHRDMAMEWDLFFRKIGHRGRRANTISLWGQPEPKGDAPCS